MFLTRNDAVPNCLNDILHGNDGIHRNAVLLIHGLHGGLVALQRTLHAVYGDDHTRDVHVCRTLELGINLSHCLAGGHNVLDDDNTLAVFQLLADKHAALAVILDFLAVEAEVHGFPVLVGECHSCGSCQRDALISRPEQGIHRNVVLFNACGIVATQLHELVAVVIVAGIDTEPVCRS